MKFKHTLFCAVPFLAMASIALTSTGVSFVANQSEEVAIAESYDDWLATWSKENHLYIHYNRGTDATDYDDYCLWLWQHAPQNIAGSLWAYGGNTKVSTAIELVPMSKTYMTQAQVKSGGDTMFTDGYGAIIDVDLTLDIVSGRKVNGKSEGDASLKGATELGFLVVLQSSMGGGHHWTSDGGKETYLENFDKAPKINGAVHVFLNTGDFDHYVYESFKLLSYHNRNKLFLPDWPIYTTTHNTPPALYGKNADVQNSFIANGAIIKGKVLNSIISRDVIVEKGAELTNCIIFTNSIVGKDVKMEFVVTDKNANISTVKELKGEPNKILYIKQGAKI